MFHAVFERQARRTFELVNQHDYDSILASVTPDIHHRFGGPGSWSKYTRSLPDQGISRPPGT